MRRVHVLLCVFFATAASAVLYFHALQADVTPTETEIEKCTDKDKQTVELTDLFASISRKKVPNIVTAAQLIQLKVEAKLKMEALCLQQQALAVAKCKLQSSDVYLCMPKEISSELVDKGLLLVITPKYFTAIFGNSYFDVKVDNYTISKDLFPRVTCKTKLTCANTLQVK